MLVKNIKPSGNNKKKGTKKKPATKKQLNSLNIQQDEQDDFEQQMLKQIESENLRKQQQEKANKQKQKNSAKQQTIKPLEIQDMDEFEKQIKQKEEEVMMKELEKEKKHDERLNNIMTAEQDDDKLKKLQQELLEKERLELLEQEKLELFEKEITQQQEEEQKNEEVVMQTLNRESEQEKKFQDKQLQQQNLKEQMLAEQSIIKPSEVVTNFTEPIEPPHEPHYIQSEIDFVEQISKKLQLEQDSDNLVDLVKEQFASDLVEEQDAKIVIEESGIQHFVSEQVNRYQQGSKLQVTLQQVKPQEERVDEQVSQQTVHSLPQQITYKEASQAVTYEQPSEPITYASVHPSKQITLLEIERPVQDLGTPLWQQTFDKFTKNNQEHFATPVVQSEAAEIIQSIQMAQAVQVQAVVQIQNDKEQYKLDKSEGIIVEKVEKVQQLTVQVAQQAISGQQIDESPSFVMFENVQNNQISLIDQNNNTPDQVQQILQLQEQHLILSEQLPIYQDNSSDLQEKPFQFETITLTQNKCTPAQQQMTSNQVFFSQHQPIAEYQQTATITIQPSVQLQHEQREDSVNQFGNKNQIEEKNDSIVPPNTVDIHKFNSIKAETQEGKQVQSEYPQEQQAFLNQSLQKKEIPQQPLTQQLPQNGAKQQQSLISSVQQQPVIEKQTLPVIETYTFQPSNQTEKPFSSSQAPMIKKTAPKGKSTKKGKPLVKPKAKSILKLSQSNLLDSIQQDQHSTLNVQQPIITEHPQLETKPKTVQLTKIHEISTQHMKNDNLRSEQTQIVQALAHENFQENDEMISKDIEKDKEIQEKGEITEKQNYKTIIEQPKLSTALQPTPQITPQVDRQDKLSEEETEIPTTTITTNTKSKPPIDKKSKKKSSKPNTKKETTTKKPISTIKQSLILPNQQKDSFFTQQVVEIQPQKQENPQNKNSEEGPYVSSEVTEQVAHPQEKIIEEAEYDKRESFHEEKRQSFEGEIQNDTLNFELRQQEQYAEPTTLTELSTVDPVPQQTHQSIQSAISQPAEQPKPWVEQDLSLNEDQPQTVINASISLNTNNKKKPLTSSTIKKPTNSSTKTKTKGKTTKTPQSIIFQAGKSIDEHFQESHEVGVSNNQTTKEQPQKLIKQIDQTTHIKEETQKKQQKALSSVKDENDQTTEIQTQLILEKPKQIEPKLEHQQQPLSEIASALTKQEPIKAQQYFEQKNHLKQHYTLEQSYQTVNQPSAEVINLELSSIITKISANKPSTKKTTKNSNTTKKSTTNGSSKPSTKTTNFTLIKMDMEQMLDMEKTNVIVESKTDKVESQSEKIQSPTYKEASQEAKKQSKPITEESIAQVNQVTEEAITQVLTEEHIATIPPLSVIEEPNKSLVIPQQLQGKVQISVSNQEIIKESPTPQFYPQQEQLISEPPSFISLLQVNKKKKKKPVTSKTTNSKTISKKTTSKSDMFFVQEENQLIETQSKQKDVEIVQQKDEIVKTTVQKTFLQPVSIEHLQQQQTIIQPVTKEEVPSVLAQDKTNKEQAQIQVVKLPQQQTPIKQPELLLPPYIEPQKITQNETLIPKPQPQEITKEVQIFDIKQVVSKPTKKPQKSAKNTTSTTNKSKTTKVPKSLVMNLSIETSKIDIDENAEGSEREQVQEAVNQSNKNETIQQKVSPTVPGILTKKTSQPFAESRNQDSYVEKRSKIDQMRPTEIEIYHVNPQFNSQVPLVQPTPMIQSTSVTQKQPHHHEQNQPVLNPAACSMIEQILKTQLNLVKLNNDSNLELIREKVNMIRQTLNDKLKRKQERALELKRLQEEQARVDQAKNREEQQDIDDQEQNQGEYQVFKENIQLKKIISQQSAR